MRMLVTGGAGFIGSHLTEALLAAGHEVTVIDDLSTGRASNLKAVESNERLTTRWASILQDERLDKFIEQSDIVFHLAAAVGVRLILEKPVDTIEANVLGTDRVLKAAARAQCTVVIASTSEVYGKNDRVPLSEDDDGVFGPTVKSRWSYAVSKAIDEFLGLAYCRDRGVPVDRAYEAGFEEPRQRVPDITKLRRTLDFTPAVDLDTTLRNVIEFERRQG